MAGRIDDDEAIPPGRHLDGFLQRPAAGRFFRRGRIIDGSETEMLGYLEPAVELPRPNAAVLDVTGQASLPRVQIDGGNALPRFGQRDGRVHRHRGLARSALFIADDDHTGRCPAYCILNRHGIAFGKSDFTQKSRGA
jgi:hypothetical protein